MADGGGQYHVPPGCPGERPTVASGNPGSGGEQVFDHPPSYEQVVREFPRHLTPSTPPRADIRSSEPSPVYNPAWIPQNRIVATFGTHGRNDGQFRTPIAAAQCPQSGNYIVSDMGNRRVQIWSPQFQHIYSFGHRGLEPGQLKYPCGVAVAPNGNIYVSDTGNCQVTVFDKHGSFIKSFGRKGSGPGEFVNPYGMTIAPNGLVYVCDGDNLRIQAYRQEGTFLHAFGSTPVQYFDGPPREITAYDNGVLAVTNWTNCVNFFTRKAAYRNTWCGEGDSEVRSASGIAVTPNYDMILVDRVREEVRICKSNREVKVYGTSGIERGSFKSPRGALRTKDGHLLVVDTGNDRVQVLDIL